MRKAASKLKQVKVSDTNTQYYKTTKTTDIPLPAFGEHALEPGPARESHSPVPA